jgi:hypothetical protein
MRWRSCANSLGADEDAAMIATEAGVAKTVRLAAHEDGEGAPDLKSDVATSPAPRSPMNPEVESAYKAVLSDAVPTSWRVHAQVSFTF